MKRYLVFLALCFFLTAPTHSQIIDLEKDQLWVDIGFGVLETYGVTEINFNLGLNLVSGSILYKIRTLINTEFDLFGPTPSEEFYSLGALIGKGFSTDYIHIYFSGGIGITGGVKRGEYLYTEPSSGWLDIGDGRNYERETFLLPLQFPSKLTCY
ncbi:MAG: hypothetical protein WC951_00655 [Bacteroidales bacterium]